MYKFIKHINFIIIAIIYGCSFNPYPLSNTVDVGPPISLADKSPKEEEIINEEVKNQNEVSSNDEEILLPGITIEKIDDLTIHASWDLEEGRGVILPPVELISVIKKECDNNSNGHLLSFSSFEGIVKAIFKCW